MTELTTDDRQIIHDNPIGQGLDRSRKAFLDLFPSGVSQDSQMLSLAKDPTFCKAS